MAGSLPMPKKPALGFCRTSTETSSRARPSCCSALSMAASSVSPFVSIYFMNCFPPSFYSCSLLLLSFFFIHLVRKYSCAADSTLLEIQ